MRMTKRIKRREMEWRREGEGRGGRKTVEVQEWDR